MKKLVFLFAVLSLAVFILLPNLTDGKYNVSKPVVADGWPLPPPVPPSPSANTLIADGWPLPPPVPPSTNTDTLIADGWPLPLPPPPGSGSFSVSNEVASHLA